VSGNALVLIVTGDGTRVAESYNGNAAGAPLLQLLYTTGGGGEPTNQAPTVNAGPDQTVTLPQSAALDGTAADDGLPNPPATLSTAWSMVSGPAAVSFADPTSVDTTATFTVSGTYVLRLTADDSELNAFDELTVTVDDTGDEVTIDVRVVNVSDDAEEESSTGEIELNSSDLELVFDHNSQVVGIRFASVDVPQGATIVSAYVQFQVDETDSLAALLTIEGQAIDHALAFSSARWNISSRARTAAAVLWSPPPWNTEGAAGPDQRTPDLSPIIQEIVGRPGWVSGNALALIVTGDGVRVAESYNGDASSAPLLHLAYITGAGGEPTNQAPMVDAGSDHTVALLQAAALDGTVADDGLPNPPATLSTAWSMVSGPAAVSFADPASVDTTATFTVAGTYVLRLTANDSELNAFDELTVTVHDAGDEVSLDVRVSHGSDDAEEEIATGVVDLYSSDLELVFDHNNQVIGMRFASVDVPQGATIVSAYVQFQVDETDIQPALLTIEGQAVDHALVFSSASWNISSRARTVDAVIWSPPPWNTEGVAGPDQRTPDLSPIIQEIVDRPGWVSGNALALIITGDGVRVAESYNGDASSAPLLQIVYRMQ
jgi:hypothetical protein